MPRFYFRYQSHITDIPAKIKMEINFVDKTLYFYQPQVLRSVIHDLESEEIRFLFKDQWIEYTTPISIECCDPKEIYIEKCRAALTRIKYKLRDIIDIYTIENRYNYSIPILKHDILEKTRFMLDIYKKYQENIDIKVFPRPDTISTEELTLFMVDPPEDLEENIDRIHQQLEEVKSELTL